MRATLLRNGWVLDGTGAPARPADVLLRDGLIAEVGPALDAPPDALVVNAAGKLVTPGFIDIHRHCDLAALHDPAFGLDELAQGLTTVVGGNCGLSPTPASPAYAEQAADFLAPCLGEAPGARYERFGEYLAALEAAPLRLSMGMLAAVGAVKIAVKGFAATPFTREEMDAARGLLREALEAGALGASVGVMYTPECYTTPEEYARLLSVAAPFGRPVCCHIRAEGDHLVDAVREMLDIGRRAEVPIHISHFKATGVRNWGSQIGRAIELVEAARAAGQDATVDFYPYTAGATTLLSLLPPCLLWEDRERLWAFLATAAGAEAVREALAQPQPGWDNMVASIGWERVLLASVEMPGGERFAGRSLAQAAELLGCEPSTALCALLSASRGKAGVVLQSMAEPDVETVARLPYSFLISDALYGRGATHPRLCGAFPRFLRRYVRERGVLALPEAVAKMTSLPAARLGLADRGRLAPGLRADVLLFDPERIADRATYEQPRLRAEGVDGVWVAGVRAWPETAPPHGAARRKNSPTK